MKINDTRSRKTGRYTGIVNHEYSYAPPSITNVGTFYKADETVSSYRSPVGSSQKATFETFSLTKSDGTTKRIRTKEPNEFVLVKTSRNRAIGGLTVTEYGGNQDQTYSRKGDILDWLFPDSWLGTQSFAPDTRIAGPALNEAYSKANAPQYSGFTQILEMQESLAMLGELGVNAYRFIADMKRKLALHKKKAVNDVSMDDLAALWLSYRYGFLPLYLSIRDLINLKLAKPTYQMVVYDGSTKRADDSSATVGVIAGGHPLTATFARRNEKSANCRLYVKYKRDENHLGFGAYDLMLSAWEKITLSFVIDWFVGVGDWLGAYRPGGVNVQWSYVTVKQDFTSQSSASIRRGTGATLGNPTFSTETRKLRKSRVARITPAVPTVLPAWETEALKWYRQIDALALSWAILSGHLLRD